MIRLSFIFQGMYLHAVNRIYESLFFVCWAFGTFTFLESIATCRPDFRAACYITIFLIWQFTVAAHNFVCNIHENTANSDCTDCGRPQRLQLELGKVKRVIYVAEECSSQRRDGDKRLEGKYTGKYRN